MPLRKFDGSSVSVVVQFYPWFKFFFLLFQTHYHQITITKTKEKKFEPRIKLNHNISIGCDSVLFLSNADIDQNVFGFHFDFF